MSKLGLKSISEMTEAELRELVSADRSRRVATRAAGLINRIAKDKKGVAKPKSQAPLTLESVGLAPALILKLRASGKSDLEIINSMKAGGIL